MDVINENILNIKLSPFKHIKFIKIDKNGDIINRETFEFIYSKFQTNLLLDIHRGFRSQEIFIIFLEQNNEVCNETYYIKLTTELRSPKQALACEAQVPDDKIDNIDDNMDNMGVMDNIGENMDNIGENLARLLRVNQTPVNVEQIKNEMKNNKGIQLSFKKKEF